MVLAFSFKFKSALVIAFLMIVEEKTFNRVCESSKFVVSFSNYLEVCLATFHHVIKELIWILFTGYWEVLL